MKRRQFIQSLGLGLISPTLLAEPKKKRPSLELMDKKPPIPDFNLVDFEGKEHRPDLYKGKVLLINFWATWCPPCLAEMDSMARLYEIYKNEPFHILAIAMSQSAEQLKSYSAKHPHPFPLLPDPDGKASEAFGVTGLPTSYLTNPNGWLIFRAQGGRQWDSERMQRAVKLLLS